ncbi:hypothetical protein D910_05480 [Dendroctonus ponderosae]|uniref:Uncharacterized protein n=1 Tax=Dendroctonus ponderosae TaxID=77166 RepID=U4UBW1_DENPD|nr:hypothetical protein D910_05480 [Dendroctonus ponderosae]
MDADSGQSKGVLEALHNNCTFSNTGYLIVLKTPPQKGLHSYHVCNMHRTLEHIKYLFFRTPVQIEQQLINRTREAAQNMSPDSKSDWDRKMFGVKWAGLLAPTMSNANKIRQFV